MTDTGAKAFRWAIFGTGQVARKFALDLAGAGAPAILHSVASRDPGNARAFAAQLGVARAADSYAAALEGADIVYIATPATLHEAHARMAIAAGKAVLVEKPFASDAAAAQRIAAAAAEAGVFCMEAMWTRFQPLLGELRARIAAGALGDPLGLEARFMAATPPAPGLALYDPAGGGALLHRGLYPLSLAHFLLGGIARVQAAAAIGATGVDEDCALTLTHKSGALSTLRASLRTSGPEGAVLFGTRATLAIEGPIWRPTGALLMPVRPALPPRGARRFEAFRESTTGLRVAGLLGTLRGSGRRGSTRIAAPFAGNGYRHQALAVMQALREGRTEDPRMTLADSIAILDAVDAARAAWQQGDRA